MPNIETYKDDPAKFVEDAYSEWKDHYDKNISAADEEGKRLFCNYSAILERRKRDQWNKRSAYFVPLVQPHITSRVGQFMTIILSEDPPLKFHPLPGTSAENAERAQKVVTRRMFGERLQNVNRFAELLTAAEIRKLAAVKLGVETETWKELSLEPDTVDWSNPEVRPFLKDAPEQLGGPALPIPTEPLQLGMKRKVVQKEGARHPTWWLLPQGAYFYDPYPEKKHRLFCGDVMRVSEAYLRQEEAVGRFKNVDEAVQMLVGEGTGGYPDDTPYNTQQQDLASTVQYGYDDQIHAPTEGPARATGQHKHLLKCCYARVPKKDGANWTHETELRKIVTVNGIKVEDRPSPWLLFDDPYVEFKALAVPNQPEGISTAENLAPLQHVLNELHNNGVDAVSYLLFSPLQKDSRSRILNEAIFEPNRIWNITKLKETGGIKPIVNPQSSAAVSQIFAHERLIKENAENLSASTDLIQGTRGVQTDRTLGETKLRHQATLTRLNLSLLQYGVGIAELADKHCKIYQQTIDLEQGLNFFTGEYDSQGLAREEQIAFDQIKGRFTISLPHVAGYVDTYTQQLMWTMLYDRLKQDPLFLTPPQHYKLVKRFLQAHKVSDLDELLPPEPEMAPEMLLQFLQQVMMNTSRQGGPELRPKVTSQLATAEPKIGITQT